MKLRMKGMSLVLVAGLVFTGCAPAVPAAPAEPAPTAEPAAAAASYEGFAKGPNGEEATAAKDVVLTEEEYAKLKAGNYKASMLWAGAGEWYNAMTEGAKAEFEKMGVEVVSTSDAQFDPAKQSTDIETTMALKPNIILSLPVDPVSAERAFKPAVDAGVTLVFADNGVDNYKAGKEYTGICTGDHYGMGRAAADLMAKAIGGKGNIGFIYHDADFFVTNNRDNAFKNTIQTKYPDIKIVFESGFSEESATGEVASAMLTQNPELDGVYVAWDIAAEPVVAELRAQGKTDTKVVTFDLGGNNDLDMALNGNVYGKVADKPYQIGQTMAKMAAYKLLGKEAPPFVLSDIVLMTRENMVEAWKDSLNKEPAQTVIDALKK